MRSSAFTIPPQLMKIVKDAAEVEDSNGQSAGADQLRSAENRCVQQLHAYLEVVCLRMQQR